MLRLQHTESGATMHAYLVLPNCRRLMGILPPLHCILGIPQKAIEEYKRRNIENIASKDHRKLSPFLFFYGKIADLFHLKALIR